MKPLQELIKYIEDHGSVVPLCQESIYDKAIELQEKDQTKLEELEERLRDKTCGFEQNSF